ncbi:MAG TPA: ABC transporter ATP-binding protein [Candidatus Dormibacteraeota bacterium]|nr:ABC transporter ATP-binding protein [Candidatus Dormibacteraeota bacterium]
MTHLTIRSLAVEYGSGSAATRPISDLALDVESGELVLLMGPSGCGKTTLISCLAGVLTPARGTIRLGDLDVTSLRGAALARYRRRTCGVVFQAFNLIPSLSALENVAVPLQSAGSSWTDARARATVLLRQVGLAEQAGRLPGQLSGGQQQRVAIARALGADPPLLLADEPTAHLDDEQASAVARILRDLARPGRIVLVATHDERLSATADRVVRLGAAGGHATPPPLPVAPFPLASVWTVPAPSLPASPPPPPRVAVPAVASTPPPPRVAVPAVAGSTPPPPPVMPPRPYPAVAPARAAAASKPSRGPRRRAARVLVAVTAAAGIVTGFALMRSGGPSAGSPAPVAQAADPSTAPAQTVPAATATPAPPTAATTARPAAATRPPATRRPSTPAPQQVTKVASSAPVPATAAPAAPVAAAVAPPVTHTFSVSTAYATQASVSWYDVAVRPMRITVTPDAFHCAFMGGRVTTLSLYQGSALIANFVPVPGCGSQTTPLYTPSTAAPATYTLVAQTSVGGMTITLQVVEGS